MKSTLIAREKKIVSCLFVNLVRKNRNEDGGCFFRSIYIFYFDQILSKKMLVLITY